MKFLVECELKPEHTSFDLPVFTDLAIEAPNERIAVAKVRNCFPGCTICNPAELIEDESIFRVLRPYLRPFIYTNIGVLVLLFCWNVPLLKVLLYAPGISFVIFLAGAFYFEFVDRITNRAKREEIMDLEREYSRREGYREGWSDCEKKANPKFTEWTEADGRDIHPYRDSDSKI